MMAEVRANRSVHPASAVQTQRDPARRPRAPRGVALTLSRHKGALIGGSIVVLFVLMAAFAPWLAPRDPLDQDLTMQFSPPGREHFLGTDRYGRDILSRLVWGSRISLAVGVTSVALGLGAGLTLGTVAGFVGGRVESVIMRLMDIMLAFPLLLLALAIMAMLGPSLMNVMIAAGVSSIPHFARVAYGSTLAVKEREFITAARAVGLTHERILWRHVLPNILAPIIVLVTLRMATVIVLEANLSFIGVGVEPPTPSWGSLVNDGLSTLQTAPWISMPPALVISVLVLGINLFGDGLRDILDPHIRV